MARHAFGYSSADWVFLAAGGDVGLDPAAVVTLWDSLAAGNQITDLLASDGVTPVTFVTTDANGYIPSFFGPDTAPSDTRKLAADANGGSGPRSWIYASDWSDEVNAIEGSIATAQAGINVNTGVLAGAPQWVFANGDGSWPPRPATTRAVLFANTVATSAPPISADGGGDGGALPGDIYLGP